MNEYKSYYRTVEDYFRHRPDDLLVLNVAEEGAFQKLAGFLGKKSNRTEFPWRNRTDDML